MRKNKLIVALLALSAFTADAFTVHDLVGSNNGTAVQKVYFSKMDRIMSLYTGLMQYPDVMGISREVHFDYVYDINGNILPNYVKLCGLTFPVTCNTSASRDFIFTIADASNYPTSDGVRLVLPTDDMWSSTSQITETAVCTSGDAALAALVTYTDEQILNAVDQGYFTSIGCYYFWIKTTYSYRSALDYWVGEISRNAQGNITVNFASGAYLVVTGYKTGYNYGAFNTSKIPYRLTTTDQPQKIIDKMTIETFSPTASMSYYEYPYGTSSYSSTPADNELKTAQVTVATNADGTLSLFNLFGRGYTIESTDTDRRKMGMWKGRLSNGKLILTMGQSVDATYNSGYGGNGQRIGDYQEKLYILNKFPAKGFDEYNDIEAELSGEARLEHRTRHDNNFWVKPGYCRTFVSGVNANFGNQKIAGVFYNPTNGRYESTPAWGGINLSIDELDVTLRGEISSGNLGISETQLWPRVNFDVTGNDAYVDSYTLWMIPATLVENTNPASGHVDFTHENGHPLGFAVATVGVDKYEQIGSGDYPKRYDMGRLFDKTEMSVEQLDPENKYYMYVQANYRTDAAAAALSAKAQPRAGALQSTFHGLFGNYTVTGAADLEMPGQEMVVNVQPGCIVVENATQEVEIFSTDGRCIYRGGNGTVEVLRGVYLVRSGATVRKVSVS